MSIPTATTRAHVAPPSVWPLILDADDAIDYYRSTPEITDAAKAYVVAALSREGWSNAKIRRALNIPKVYVVTHLKRAGLRLSDDELQLWHKNPTRITLGHVRALAKWPQKKREPLLRDLLTKRLSVAHCEKLARSDAADTNVDTVRFAQHMSEALGRDVKIKTHPQRNNGQLTLSFFSLDDLDAVCRQLGFVPKDF